MWRGCVDFQKPDRLGWLGSFVNGLSQVARGGIYLPSGVRDYVGKADKSELKMIGSLTERERTVLTEVGRGLDNASIAEALVTSEETVKTHPKAIREKVGESDRVRLALLAIRTGVQGWAQAISTIDCGSIGRNRLGHQLTFLDPEKCIAAQAIQAELASQTGLKQHSPPIFNGDPVVDIHPSCLKMRNNSGTMHPDRALPLRAQWQQWPETPALIRRNHTEPASTLPINAVILQREGSEQVQAAHQGAKQHHTPCRLAQPRESEKIQQQHHPQSASSFLRH